MGLTGCSGEGRGQTLVVEGPFPSSSIRVHRDELRPLGHGVPVPESPALHPVRTDVGSEDQRAHGGAIFGLIDEAFEMASQTIGTVAVALNVNITYVSSPAEKTRLRAEAIEISATKRTASYDIKVTNGRGELIAACQALAYRTGKPIPFLPQSD